MLIGIALQTRPEWVEEFRTSAAGLGLDCVLLDMRRSDWFEEAQKADLLLWRTHQADRRTLADARNKIPLLEQVGVRCLPTADMLWLYDSKIRQAYFFALHGIPTPRTFISSSLTETRVFLDECQYPLVRKLSHGASSVNVFMVRTKDVALAAALRALPNDLGRLHKLYCLVRTHLGLTSAGSAEGYVYLQQYVPSDGDWRVVTFGSSIVSVFFRRNRAGDFRASGSGKWEVVDIEHLPEALCDLALSTSAKHGFPVMSYDALPYQGGWLISEMSYTFLLDRVYCDTLFRRTSIGYERAPAVPVGVNHICAMLGLDPLLSCGRRQQAVATGSGVNPVLR